MLIVESIRSAVAHANVAIGQLSVAAVPPVSEAGCTPDQTGDILTKFLIYGPSAVIFGALAARHAINRYPDRYPTNSLVQNNETRRNKRLLNAVCYGGSMAVALFATFSGDSSGC